jgi:hypothetical protein
LSTSIFISAKVNSFFLLAMSNSVEVIFSSISLIVIPSPFEFVGHGQNEKVSSDFLPFNPSLMYHPSHLPRRDSDDFCRFFRRNEICRDDVSDFLFHAHSEFSSS